MMKDKNKLFSGIIAIGIYLLLVVVVLYYFNYRSQKQPRHFVEKNSQAIAVSLAGAPRLMSTRESLSKPKKQKHSPKKIRNIASRKKSYQKSKKVKNIHAKNLFASVKTSRKSIKKDTSKNNQKSTKRERNHNIKKPNNSDKGIEEQYLASVEQKLRGWPEQANFAGEQISVMLTIYPSGRFDFKVQHLSANSEFNEALITYLKQLQAIGLGRHTRTKPYKIEVEFEAIE